MLAVAITMVLPLHSGNEKLKKLNEKIEKRQADPGSGGLPSASAHYAVYDRSNSVYDMVVSMIYIE